MPRSRVRFVALTLVIPIVLAACSGGGGGSKVSADAYASTVCTHVKTWLDQIRQRASELQTAMSPGTSPTRGRDLLGSYLDNVISDTDDMINAIKDAGTPDISNGDIDRIHKIWVDAVKAVGPGVRHRDVVTAALNQLEQDLRGDRRTVALDQLRRHITPRA